jgi:hypothetical protein
LKNGCHYLVCRWRSGRQVDSDSPSSKLFSAHCLHPPPPMGSTGSKVNRSSTTSRPSVVDPVEMAMRMPALPLPDLWWRGVDAICGDLTKNTFFNRDATWPISPLHLIHYTSRHSFWEILLIRRPKMWASRQLHCNVERVRQAILSHGNIILLQ